jgi:hypothetical protein
VRSKSSYPSNLRFGTTEQLAEKGEDRPSGAEAYARLNGFTARINPCPFKKDDFSASYDAVPFQHLLGGDSFVLVLIEQRSVAGVG